MTFKLRFRRRDAKLIALAVIAPTVLALIGVTVPRASNAYFVPRIADPIVLAAFVGLAVVVLGTAGWFRCGILGGWSASASYVLVNAIGEVDELGVSRAQSLVSGCCVVVLVVSTAFAARDARPSAGSGGLAASS